MKVMNNIIRKYKCKILGKALFISFSDNNTPYDYDNKVFLNAKEALIFYRKVKAITKYKLIICKVTAIESYGRISWY
jgi:hypothetical protein